MNPHQDIRVSQMYCARQPESDEAAGTTHVLLYHTVWNAMYNGSRAQADILSVRCLALVQVGSPHRKVQSRYMGNGLEARRQNPTGSQPTLQLSSC